jgi:hypothetical protein
MSDAQCGDDFIENIERASKQSRRNVTTATDKY